MSNAAAVISIVLLAFFLAGVTVGIIAVTAVSARRAGSGGAARRMRTRPGPMDAPSGQSTPSSAEDPVP